MGRTVPIAFAKFHGLANDFIVTNVRGLPRAVPSLARAICHRHTGVGADGLVVVHPPRIKPHDAWVQFFNADGSEAEISGNGIRCAAAFLIASGHSKHSLRIETAAGVKSLHLMKAEEGKWIFRVGMGTPTRDPRKIPFKAGKPARPIVAFPLPTQRGVVPVTVTSMGNPHCTVFVSDFADLDWRAQGREIECNLLFPNRTNVEFVKVISRKEIEVRFWERGVGETMSSGTGSCAAVVACVLNRRTGHQVRVVTPAGSLQVAWPAKGNVILTGPVELVARGTYYYRA